MGPIRRPETLVKDYHPTLRYTVDERRSHQHRGGSLKSQILVFFVLGAPRLVQSWGAHIYTSGLKIRTLCKSLENTTTFKIL
jgi:hypothetical protein